MIDSSAVRDDASDEALVTAFQGGDEQAFTVIVNRYKHRLTRLALAVVHNEEDALDIVQDAFIKVYHGLAKFRQTSALYTWLYRVVMNRAIDVVRHKQRAPLEPVEEPPADVPDHSETLRPDRAALRAELREHIFAAVDKLPRKHREVILLREIEGLSYKEIADALRCSEGTVMSRLFYARERLRQDLEPYLKGGT
jgi:RNA polymerase sigma-70 factor (ECF subfamily)